MAMPGDRMKYSDIDVEQGLNISHFHVRNAEEDEAPHSEEEIDHEERPPAELPMTRVFPWSLVSNDTPTNTLSEYF